MQRILHYIAGRKTPVSVAEIAASIASHETKVHDATALSTRISANLSQLLATRKVQRTGQRGAYRYTSTDLTLADRRKVDAQGAPRNIKQLQRAKPLAPPAPAKPTPTLAQRLAVANLGKPPRRKPGEPETVAEFLRRGGRIQHLAHGESSRPPFEDLRALDKRSMRERLYTLDEMSDAETVDVE